MPIDKNYKPYKHVGNIAVDMVASCINNYHMQGAKLKVIRLDKIHWHMFKCFVIESLPGVFTMLDTEIDFDGVIVCQSHVLSNEVITWEFEKVKTEKKMSLVN
jgi:hypothetical protein